MDSRRKIKVLVVDDDKAVRDFLVRFLKVQHIEAQEAEDGMRAIELAKNEKFDLVFMDIRMPKMNGLQVFGELKKINPEIISIFMTGYAIEATLLDSTTRPPTVCLRKPFDNIMQIKDMVAKVMQGIDIRSDDSGDLKDRRAFIRLDIVLEVDYKLKQSQGPFIHSFSKDVAPGGIKLSLQENLPAGTKLDMVLQVLGCSAVCSATGEIVWIAESKDKAGYYDAGIKLIEVDFSQLADLIISCGKAPQKDI